MSKGALYLAAPWVDRFKMPARAKQFEDAGYEITRRWWEYEEHDQDSHTDEYSAFLAEQGKEDILGVITADAVVVFNTAKSEGKAVEQGIAIGCDIPIIVIGKRGEFSSNVFHYVDFYYTWVNSAEDAINTLEELIEE